MMPHTREDQHETGLGTRPLVAQQGNESENVDDTFPYIQYLQEQQMADGWKEFFRDDNKGPDNEVVDATLKMVTPTLGETDERLLEMAREMWTAPVELRTDYENRMTETRYRPILNEIIEAAYDLGIPAVRPIELATSTDISCTPMVGAAEIFVELLELGGFGGRARGWGEFAELNLPRRRSRKCCVSLSTWSNLDNMKHSMLQNVLQVMQAIDLHTIS